MKRSERQRSSLVALAVGVAGIALSPSLAHAQDPGGSASAPKGEKPLTIDVIGAILYDSNVSKGRDVVADARDLNKSDVIYSPGAQVAVYLPLGRHVVYLNASGGYDLHQHNKTLDSERAKLTGGGVARVGSCEFSLGGAYAVSQSDLASLPIQVTRNRQTTRNVNSQVTCEAGAGLIGFVGAQAADTSNSANVNVLDSDTVSFNGGLGYGNARLGTLQVIGGYTKTTYERSANPVVVAPQPGFEAYMAGVRYSRAIGNRLNGSASLGYQEVRSESPLVKDLSSLTGAGELEYRVNTRIGLTLAYDRAAAPTIVEGFDYVLEQMIRFEGRYSLSSRIQSSLGAKWNKTDYKGTGLVLLDIPTEERIRSLFAQVALKLGRTASVAVNASQEKRKSQPAIFNYTAYQVGVTAKKSF